MDGLTLNIPPARDTGDMPRRAEPYARLAVIGMGSWGTALAAVAASAGCDTRLWGRRKRWPRPGRTPSTFPVSIFPQP